MYLHEHITISNERFIYQMDKKNDIKQKQKNKDILHCTLIIIFLEVINKKTL